MRSAGHAGGSPPTAPSGAYLLAYDRSFAGADAEFAKAIELDPSEADARAALSDIAVLAGRVEEGLEHIRKAFRLNPFPASLARLGRLDEARAEVELFLGGNPHFTIRHRAMTEPFRDGTVAPLVRPTPRSDPWRHDRGHIVS